MCPFSECYCRQPVIEIRLVEPGALDLLHLSKLQEIHQRRFASEAQADDVPPVGSPFPELRWIVDGKLADGVTGLSELCAWW